MTAETFFQMFNQYGLILVCAVVFCEYMNLPGFPAGVIMPCVGVLIARSELSLPLTVFLSVVAGVLGSLVIYAVCYWGGEPVMEKLFGRSKKFKSLVRKCHEFIDAQHGRGLAIIRVSAPLFPSRPDCSGCRSSGSSAGLRRASRCGIPHSFRSGISSARRFSAW